MQTATLFSGISPPPTKADLLQWTDSLPRRVLQINAMPTYKTVKTEGPFPIHFLSQLNPKNPNDKGFYVLKKDSLNPWGSSTGHLIYAPYGDPTTPIIFLRGPLAAFLGFILINENTLIAPDAHFLNQRIDELNQVLVALQQEPIFLRFENDQHLTDKRKTWGPQVKYAEAFVRNLILNRLYSYTNEEIIHDTSFHSLNILWTESQLKPLFTRLKFLIDFIDFIRNPNHFNSQQFPLLNNINLREAYINLLFIKIAIFIDGKSGGIPSIINRSMNLRENTVNNNRFDQLIYVLGDSYLNLINPDGTFSKKVAFYPHFEYTLSHWLTQTFNEYLKFNIMTLLETRHQVFDAEVDYSVFYHFLKKEPQLRELKINFNEFLFEINSALEEFYKQNALNAQQIVAVINHNYEITSGIGQGVHVQPEDFRKRITVLKKALANYLQKK